MVGVEGTQYKEKAGSRLGEMPKVPNGEKNKSGGVAHTDQVGVVQCRGSSRRTQNQVCRQAGHSRRVGRQKCV